MKKFFNSPKSVFITAAILLNIGALTLVFFDKIDFSTFLQSTGTISAGIFALYQFYIKEAVVKEANQIVNTANSIYQENVTLKKTNNDLNTEISNIKMTEVKNAEVIKPKRKYTKRKKA